MFRFTIRELVLLTLMVAMGVGWWLDRSRLQAIWTMRMDSIRQDLLERELVITVLYDGNYHIGRGPHQVFFDRP